jgi:hypothetical protein
LAEALAPPAHETPQAPQFCTSVASEASHPSARFTLQSPLPALQMALHAPALQTALALA